MVKTFVQSDLVKQGFTFIPVTHLPEHESPVRFMFENGKVAAIYYYKFHGMHVYTSKRLRFKVFSDPHPEDYCLMWHKSFVRNDGKPYFLIVESWLCDPVNVEQLYAFLKERLS